MKSFYKQLLISLLSITLLSYFGFATAIDSIQENDSNEEAIEKLIETIDPNGKEDFRLEMLNDLSSEQFAQVLEHLFEPIGGEAVKHWGFNPIYSTNELSENPYYHKVHDNVHGFESDYFYMTKSVFALQYILFYLTSNVNTQVEKIERAKKIAQALNHIQQDKVIQMLYGRYDARFLGDKDRFTPTGIKSANKKDYYLGKKALVDDSTKEIWLYETYKMDEMNSKIYLRQKNRIFRKNTVRARLPLEYVRLLIPYLNKEILTLLSKKEDYLVRKNLRSEL